MNRNELNQEEKKKKKKGLQEITPYANVGGNILLGELKKIIRTRAWHRN